MKKSILKFFLVSFCLFIFSFIIIVLSGRTYTTSFVARQKNYNFSIDNVSGEIEVLEEKIKGDEFVVKVRAIKPGSVDLFFSYDDASLKIGKRLYVHKSMVITEENYFGKCTMSELIPISLTISLSYLLYILIKRYRECVKENLYQYRNVAYLGIIIFVLYLILSSLKSVFDYYGLLSTVRSLIDSFSVLSFILLPAATITFILVTISNVKLIIKEGMSFKNLLGLFLGIFCCILPLIPDKIYLLILKSGKINIFNLNSIWPYLYEYIEAIVYMSVAYLECVLIGTIIVVIKSFRRKIKCDKDYMIILGCKIRKDGSLTPLLQGRVDKALEFRNMQLEETNKDLVFIPSGGKGNDEVIAEGEAIKNYLVSKGIKPKNIIVENKSKNTYENIKFSSKLIKEKNANIAFSTTNYHVFRAGLIATSQGLNVEGIGSKTKLYFGINAFIREFIGTLYSERKKHIIVILLILISLVFLIAITYFANNIL